MMQSVKWAFLLCLVSAVFTAPAQETSTSGSTSLDYDSQTNSLIATCTLDPSYETLAYYETTYTFCGIGLTGEYYPTWSDLFATSEGSTYATVEFTPTAGVSYTAWGQFDLYAYYEYYRYEGLYGMYDYWDFYDYSYYEDNGMLYDAPNSDLWNGNWDPVPAGSYICLGQVPAGPVIAPNPTYAKVISDPTGQNLSGIEIRTTTYQVYNANGSVAANIPVGENFSATSWSCTPKPYPGTQTTLCYAPYETDSNGKFTDIWSDYGNSYTPPNCGSETVIDHWQWCAPSTPQTFMTLSGFIHTISSKINGYINPPNEIPQGTTFNP